MPLNLKRNLLGYVRSRSPQEDRIAVAHAYAPPYKNPENPRRPEFKAIPASLSGILANKIKPNPMSEHLRNKAREMN